MACVIPVDAKIVKAMQTNVTDISMSTPRRSTRVTCIFKTRIAKILESAATARRKDGGVSGPKSSMRPITKIGKVVQRSVPNRSLPDKSAQERIPTSMAIPPTLGVGTVWTTCRALTRRAARFANDSCPRRINRSANRVLKNTSSSTRIFGIILRMPLVNNFSIHLTSVNENKERRSRKLPSEFLKLTRKSTT